MQRLFGSVVVTSNFVATKCFVAKITDYKLFPLIVIVFSMLDQLVIGSEMLAAPKKR